jgi:hypothetical protein
MEKKKCLKNSIVVNSECPEDTTDYETGEFTATAYTLHII